MDLPDFLTESDGEIRFAGHRIGLEHLVDAYNEGDSAEMLASRYPTLSLSLVHRAIAYYLDNQVAVDAYVTSCTGDIARQRARGRQVDSAALRQRLAKGESPATTLPVQ
jgi:uncharacterized protein (DUF433 family)